MGRTLWKQLGRAKAKALNKQIIKYITMILESIFRFIIGFFLTFMLCYFCTSVLLFELLNPLNFHTDILASYTVISFAGGMLTVGIEE